jgi:hypothetical protein
LARHPKKKGDEKKPSAGDNINDNSPEISRPPETDESKIKDKLDKLFWLRVGLGVLAGTLSAIIGEPIESYRLEVGFGIMIILFIVSYLIAKSMKIPILPTEMKKLLTTGYGSYFLMFIFSWILVNTLIHPDVGISTIR